MKKLFVYLVVLLGFSFVGCSSVSIKVKKELYLTGMYSYMADAGIFQECSTGKKFPVLMKEDNLTLERAYLKHKT